MSKMGRCRFILSPVKVENKLEQRLKEGTGTAVDAADMMRKRARPNE
jgi:hypothetical protein